MKTEQRVCIVGAGPAGLALARACVRHGVAFDVYERHSDVGGIWDQSNPGSPIYDSAHFISSKTQSHYIDFPMPEDYPDYPSNKQILNYIRSFAVAYGLYQHITFNMEVTRAELVGRTWKVTLSSGETKNYCALVCATGTNWLPSMPDYPGTFAGEMRHAVTYKKRGEFLGKRVLIIGGGNSACDIASDAASIADHAAISLRRGYHFVPKHLFGVPADVFAASGPRLPMWMQQKVFAVMLKALTGDLTRFGLKKPDHRLFESHPILNTQILHHLAHGRIRAKTDVARFDGKTVHFNDGSSEDFDLVLCATGYRWEIPFVEPALFRWKSNKPDLYMNLFARDHRELYGMGYMETNGGAYKLFDEMADFTVRAIDARNENGLTAQKLDRLVANDAPDLSGGIRFVASDRHATYVEIDAYRKYMKRLRKKLGWPQLEPGAFAAQRVDLNDSA
ncbi:MAG TPA: NAD(P)-binding domain-containing protein [Rhizomicrobium sp.]|nr:NAD(P)-binding domain-containing protein [Rhizomicrobium sp.]